MRGENGLLIMLEDVLTEKYRRYRINSYDHTLNEHEHVIFQWFRFNRRIYNPEEFSDEDLLNNVFYELLYYDELFTKEEADELTKAIQQAFNKEADVYEVALDLPPEMPLSAIPSGSRNGSMLVKIEGLSFNVGVYYDLRINAEDFLNKEESDPVDFIDTENIPKWDIPEKDYEVSLDDDIPPDE